MWREIHAIERTKKKLKQFLGSKILEFDYCDYLIGHRIDWITVGWTPMTPTRRQKPVILCLKTGKMCAGNCTEVLRNFECIRLYNANGRTGTLHIKKMHSHLQSTSGQREAGVSRLTTVHIRLDDDLLKEPEMLLFVLSENWCGNLWIRAEVYMTQNKLIDLFYFSTHDNHFG